MIERPESSQPIPPHARTVFTGETFEVIQWEQLMYDGSTKIFEKLRRPDTVTVIPTFADGRILLEEDTQPGCVPNLTFPAGGVEAGEDPETAARRELLEETGMVPTELILWKSLQPISRIDWAVFTFVARGCEKRQEPEPDPGEDIKIQMLTLDELMRIVQDPRFQNYNIIADVVQAQFDPEARKLLESRLFG